MHEITRVPLAFPPATACRSCAPKHVGVVVGSYKWPKATEANVRLIRHTCGNVPILVSDDCSPGQDGLKRVCTDLGVDFVSTPRWLGHVGGDAAAFGHGLDWAKDRGLSVLVKLSFRVWWLRPRWAQRVADELLAGDHHTLTRNGNFGTHTHFHLRSEAVAMRVDAWDGRPFYDAPFAPLTGEDVVLAGMPGPTYGEWSDLPSSRETRVPDLVTHWTHDTEEYVDVARRVGVELDPSFHSGGWGPENGRGEYKWG